MPPTLKRPKEEDAGNEIPAGIGPSPVIDEQEEALIAVMDHRAREVDHIKKKILPPTLKRPKEEDAGDEIPAVIGPSPVIDEQEEALIAVMDHRAREVDHIKKKIFYFQVQLNEAQARLRDSEAQLAQLRFRRRNPPPAPPAPATPAPVSAPAPPLKPKLFIPAVSHPKVPIFTRSRKNLISLVAGTASSPATKRFGLGTYIGSQHKRKLRSLELSPADDHLFVTTALDGVMNLWQIRNAGQPGASLVRSIDCASPGQRRWPEAIAWHPDGGSVFCAYTADGGDSQISIVNPRDDSKVVFLEEKPHVKGIINCISFMPWEGDVCFATGGNDHSVVLWRGCGGRDGLWKPKTLHKNLHSSAVMGVVGMHLERIVMSVGTDKKIIGYDVEKETSSYRIMIDSKCMSLLPNPSDFNLVMVQSSTPEKQLRLFDIRMKPSEIHAFGWKQESSETQSALISQTWSPDGLHISSGSADPTIHIFDIRHKSGSPSQSFKAHQKRVFKAAWHPSRSLLVSMSSDLQIGLHQISAA